MMNNISSIVIDDEAFNRQLIQSMISQLNPEFKVLAEAATISEAYRMIELHKPDVIFLDIKMPDGTGFDLLKLFDTITFEVVFVTGFDEYALKAFDYNALDYILKPIDPIKFSTTLKKIQSRIITHFNYFENLKGIMETYDVGEAIITKIPIHYNDKVMLLSIHDIMYIQSCEGCTCFYKSGTVKHMSSKQLSDFSFILDAFPNFIKITRGMYINLNFIDSYSKGSDCTITMKDGSIHEISRRKKTQILETIHTGKKFI